MDKLYNTKFFKRRKNKHNQEVEIAKVFYDVLKPKSVIDLGTGIGSFISGLKDLGVNQVCGLDPWTPYLDENIWIPENVRSCIFNTDCSTYFEIEQKYELCLNIEVAEHIEPLRSHVLIDNICSISNTCIFTSAGPGSRGTGHINLQEPEFWTKLFNANKFYIDKIKTNQLKTKMKQLKHNKMSRDLADKIKVFQKST